MARYLIWGEGAGNGECYCRVPEGSKNKYEIDKKTGLIKLDRAMKTSQDYPFDYGFVPQTLWEDGDALDVVLLSTYPLAPGILVDARVVGVMHMVDCGESDDKILAVPAKDPRWDMVKTLKDVNPHTLKEIRHFLKPISLSRMERRWLSKASKERRKRWSL